MRAAVHFGHTIDYVVRVLIWRKLTKDDVDEPRWVDLIKTLLGRHGRLGNDSEVCWLLFAAQKFGIKIPKDIALTIIRNCGPLSMVALLDIEDGDEPDKEVFQFALEFIKLESANGPFWPLFLEWASSGWDGYAEVKKLSNNQLIDSMADEYVFLHDKGRLTRVFGDVAKEDYGSVVQAIESRISSYDDEDEAATQQT
jgi:hypothetical protein